jgi:cytoskeletal protein CcmA (bactofilin family)
MAKLKAFGAEELNGFLDLGTEVVGELHFKNAFRIDARVKGRIVSENTLVVGESGDVEADIDCGVVSIRGRVQGHVHGREKIELLAGARVQGTLESPRLVIEEGAFFQGDCDTSAADGSPAGARGTRPDPRGGTPAPEPSAAG